MASSQVTFLLSRLSGLFSRKDTHLAFGYRRVAFLGIVVALYFSASPSQAESPTTIQFDLPVTFQAIEDGDDPFWVQSAALKPDEIKITPTEDTDLSNKISDALNGQKGATNIGNYSKLLLEFLVKNGSSGQGGGSTIKIDGFDNYPANPSIGDVINLSIRIVVPPGPPIERVEVYLVSRSCPKYGAFLSSRESQPDYLLSESWSLATLLDSYRLSVGNSPAGLRRAISGRAMFSRGDVEEFQHRNGLGFDEAKQKLTREYQALTAQYLARLHEAKLVPGKRFAMYVARKEVDKIHPALQWNAGKYICTDEGPVFKFYFEGFGLREKAEIRVEGDSEFQSKLEKMYLDFSPAGRKRRLLMDGTRLPTKAMIEADLKLLRNDPLIGSVRVMASPDRIRYLCVPTPLSKRKFTVGAGVEFTPERKLTPILGFRMPAASDNESEFKFELSGGESSISGDAEYLFPIIQSTGNRFWDSTQGVVRAGGDDFDDARYGNTERKGVKSIAKDFAAGWIVRFDSFGHSDRFEATQPGPDKIGNRLFRTVEVGFRFRDTSLDGNANDLTGLDEGARSGPYFDARVFFGGNPAIGSPHTREDGWWLAGRFTADTSLRVFGGEADYLRLFTKVEGRRLWEISEKVAALGTLGVSGAWANGSTPTFDYFGAGQDGMIRGLRDTEFIGRTFIGMHAELGFDVAPLLAGKSETDSSSNSSNDSFSDSSRLVLLGPFADIGWLFDRVENGRSLAGGQALQSFGIQLEVMQISVASAPVAMSLGYGWSPQSKSDESGSVFSRVQFRF
jgi:hypothetical protein